MLYNFNVPVSGDSVFIISTIKFVFYSTDLYLIASPYTPQL